MTEIERIRALLMRVYSRATSTLDGPTTAGYWRLEVNLNEIAILVIWRGGGFTLTVQDTASREDAPHESCATVEETIGRAVARIEMAVRAHAPGRTG